MSKQKISKIILEQIAKDSEQMRNVVIAEAQQSLAEIKGTTNSIWDGNCKNKDIVQLPIDARGRYGEHLVVNILNKYKSADDVIEYNEGIQGDWDVKFNKIRIEVKTATLDNQGKFQNENIKKCKLHSDELNPYDVLVLIGVSPNNHSFKVIKYADIDFTKLHNRGKAGTGAAHKWDFRYDKYELLTDTEKLFKEITNRG